MYVSKDSMGCIKKISGERPCPGLGYFYEEPEILGKESTFRGCFELLYELCSTNSIIKQLYKKVKFIKFLFRCSHNSTFFPQTECMKLKLFS